MDLPSQHQSVVYRISKSGEMECNYIFIKNQLMAQAEHDTSQLNNTELCANVFQPCIRLI